MSETATQTTRSVRVPALVVHGTTWFGLMVAVWSAFVTLLLASPETLDDAWSWLTGLSLVPEIVTWIVVLPWALAYLVWESSWDHWLRVLILVLLVTVHVSVSAPRSSR
jgi:hypothetical protein